MLINKLIKNVQNKNTLCNGFSRWKFNNDKEKLMKKNMLGIICCCLLLILPAISLAASGYYGSVNAGITFVSDSDVAYYEPFLIGVEEWEYDAGYNFGLAFGYMMENVRVEGEVSYGSNEVDSVDGISVPSGYSIETSLLNFLVNGYYDIRTGSALTPYLTAGIGFSRVVADINLAPIIDDEYDDTVFAYQVGAGVGYAMNETMTLDFMYRFLGTADPEFSYPGGTAEAEVSSHNLTVGLRMTF